MIHELTSAFAYVGSELGKKNNLGRLENYRHFIKLEDSDDEIKKKTGK